MNKMINVNGVEKEISNNVYIDLCESLRKRVIRILYLKDDMVDGIITQYDVESYIEVLKWDLYGVYSTTHCSKFINCICELEGIKFNLTDNLFRKKVLDIASFIQSIPKD